MMDSEISSLRRLHGMLESDGVKTRDQFQDMMTAAFGHGGLELRSLADELGYSFSTVFRWHEGRSAPHPSLWPRIVACILAALKVRIEELEQDLEREKDFA
jgi:transcriptional regulator with XRE-family HTH domain